MAFLANEAVDPGAAGEAVDVQVPACLRHQAPPRRGEAGEVGHGGAGGEADVGLCRQPQQLQQPAAGGLLNGGSRGSGVAQPGVLVPRTDQPVRGQGRRKGPADDPAEEASGGHGHQSGLSLRCQVVHHLSRRRSVPGQRPAEVGRKVRRGHARANMPGFLALQPLACVPGRSLQGIAVAFFRC